MKIYIGNLPFGATDGDLRQAFEPFGTIESVDTIKDKYTGESKGFAFIEMPNAEEARKAIEALNGKDLGGREIKVNEARPRGEGRRGGGFGGGGFGGGGRRGGGAGGERRRF